MLFVGIDIGSVTAKLAALDGTEPVLVEVRRTEGRPAVALRALLDLLVDRIGEATAIAVVATGSGKSLVPDPAGRLSEILAHARAAATLHPDTRTVLEIGGQDAKLIWLAGSGDPRVVDHAMNDLCAAGTGAFLDQQAARLGLTTAALGDLAASSSTPASVAGRCAVFAKTDMIHLQQRGVPAADIAAGVCHALVRNVVATLARGRRLVPPLLFQGGVSLVAGVRAAVPAVAGIPEAQVRRPDRPLAMGALGAAMLAAAKGGRTTAGRLRDGVVEIPEPPGEPLPILRRPATRPAPPASVPPRAERPLRLGIDVGSASTKGVLLDDAGRIVALDYRPTRGRPLAALRETLAALHDRRPGASVASTCVTGSGRHLAAARLDAEAAVDEITAQARGALAFGGDGVTGVIEIGGQDAKAIALRNGRVTDFAMNRLCAAGTGSFLEEQAARLGVEVADFADLAFGSNAPARLAGKCAVFMDADLVHHQQHGARREDLLAGLAHAVVENYLRRVVGRVALGDAPMIQGGVARNEAVVAAFEEALGRPVSIHPYAAVSGAAGAALLAPESVGRPRRLARLAALPEPETRTRVCALCDNRCEITVARLGGNRPLQLGGACGRYDAAAASPGARDREDAVAELLRRRVALWEGPPSEPAPNARTVGVPRALIAHDLLPWFRTFLERLGYRVVLSAPSRRETLRGGAQALTAEPCLPAKLLLGHVAELADRGVDAIFVPGIYSAVEEDPERARAEPSRLGRRFPCVYGGQSADMAVAAGLADEAIGHRADGGPSRLETVLRRFLGIPLPAEPAALPNAPKGRPALLAPELTLNPRDGLYRPLLERFARHERLDPDAVVAAAGVAAEAWFAFRRELRRAGAEYLERHAGRGPVAVVLGHPYVVHDPLVNLQVMRRLARAGFVPIPYDMVPEIRPLGRSWEQVGWRAHRDLLRAAAWTAERPDAVPVILSCFGCGPDAFVIRYLEEALGDRPRLTLEFDDHQAEAGLETRVEAFHHAVVEASARARTAPPSAPFESRTPRITPKRVDLAGRTLILPFFHDVIAALRGFFEAQGIDARLSPPTDEDSFRAGRPYASGQECNPFTYFLGDLLRGARASGMPPEKLAFFIPSMTGACLLSQYGRGFEMAVRQAGLEPLLVYNPAFKEMTEGLPVALLNRLWEAMVAVEALGQLAADLRPFEVEPGSIDRVRAEGAVRIGDAVARGGVRRALSETVDRLAAVPRRPLRPLPAVGLVGDLFTRVNDPANGFLIRRIEQAGCRVLLSPTLTDLATAVTGERVHLGLLSRDWRQVARELALETYTRLSGTWVAGPVGKIVPPRRLDPSWRESEALVRPYLGRTGETALTANVAQTVRHLEAGAAGVLSVICHGCMIGILSEASYRLIREAYPDRPILSLTYDGLGDTHAATRVEAFLQRVTAGG